MLQQLLIIEWTVVQAICPGNSIPLPQFLWAMGVFLLVLSVPMIPICFPQDTEVDLISLF